MNAVPYLKLRRDSACLKFSGRLFHRTAPLKRKLLRRLFVRGCGIVNLFTQSRKVYEVVLDRAINFEFRYSGARPLRDLKTSTQLSTKIFPI